MADLTLADQQVQLWKIKRVGRVLMQSVAASFLFSFKLNNKFVFLIELVVDRQSVANTSNIMLKIN